ncbi:Zinc finger, RING-type,Zinc finger, RING/FYVE/PHD-type,Zinc finger, CCCH-type,Zinc finger [Cinara cedri]|uniref:RING-type E3 ubiquitin transferase n=1 Tax=Cinara cedri TaxID=506608 RepID=A0A5E4M8P8_9HEMI|nr:Zinc finger, RING-type,Zinc finger, RING/FYVE/PHD-type,Zinc finger, CCCH-type,Zinc finger [Cinara cedri]
MPIQAPQWTEFLACPVCCNGFDVKVRHPISLGCAHTICKSCLSNLPKKQCPFDQNLINIDIDQLPINYALLQLVGALIPINENIPKSLFKSMTSDERLLYSKSKKCVEYLALYLKSFATGGGQSTSAGLSRPMQRKLVTLVNCQILENEGRMRAIRAARSLGERSMTELILHHQSAQQLSTNLWAAVRARGCQFLGPAMQEEVLKLVLLALEDGSALSRKVLVMFVVQRLEPHFPQASKTSIGHVVQLLYRASCFKVSKREGDSSLMQLKEEFRTYESLRREHDAQIVEIATEAGLRIAPDQWSALLYGDSAHKSHMQSIMDKLQSPQSFSQSVQELIIALQRTGDPAKLSSLRPHFELLAGVDSNPSLEWCTWEKLNSVLESARIVVTGLTDFVKSHGSTNKSIKNESVQSQTNVPRYKVSLCRDLMIRGTCPRGGGCTFAHSEEELEKYRNKNRKNRVVPLTVDHEYLTNKPTFMPKEQYDFIHNKKPNMLSENSQDMGSIPMEHSYIVPTGQTYYQPGQQQIYPVGQSGQQQMYPVGQYGHELYGPGPHSHGMLINSNNQMYMDHNLPNHSNKMKNLSSSLMSLQNRKQELLGQIDRVMTACTLTPDQVDFDRYSMWDNGSLFHAKNGLPSPVNIQAGRPVLIRSDSILADPDEFVPFELAVNGKYGPIGGNGVNPAVPPPPPPPPSTNNNNNQSVGAKNSKSMRRPCTLSIPTQAAAAQAQFFSSTTTTTITTPLGTLRGARNSPVAASWYFNSPQGYPAAAHIVASPVGAAIGQSYITIHSPAGIIEPPNFFGGHKTPKNLMIESQKMKSQLKHLEKKINDLKLATHNVAAKETDKLSEELAQIEKDIQTKEQQFLTQWHSETATITTWGDGIWSSTTSSGFTTQPDDTYNRNGNVKQSELKWDDSENEAEKPIVEEV